MKPFYQSESWQEFDMGHPGGADGTASLLSLAKPPNCRSILDLACGRGDSFSLLKQQYERITGVDLDISQAEKWKTDFNVRLVCSDMKNLPFEDASFGTVLCECGLSLQFDDLSYVLTEAERVLEPEGLIFVSDFYRLSSNPDNQENKVLFDRAGWHQQLQSAGFELVDWRDRTKDWIAFRNRWIWKNGNSSTDGNCLINMGKEKTEYGYFHGVFRRKIK